MIRHKRSLMGLLLVLAMAVSACQSGASAQQQLQTATVTRGTITATVAASGNVSAKSQVTLAFQTTGVVKAVNVKVGDHVKAGQVMATLDDTNLQAAVTSAQAGLAVAQAQLEETKLGPLESQIKAAQEGVTSASAAYQAAKTKAGTLADQLTIDESNLSNAAEALNNAQGTYDNSFEYIRSAKPKVFVPPAGQEWSSQKATLDNATVDYNVALATYRLDQANVNNSGLASAAAQLASAQAQLADLQNTPTAQNVALGEQSVQQAQISLKQAQLNLQNAQLIAPFEGEVGDVSLQVGQQASASSGTVTLVDLSQLTTQVTVSEFDVPNIKVGQTAQITLDALPNQTYPGHVIDVSLAGVSTQGVVNYPVTVVFDQPGTQLPVRPGMSATVTIVVQERTNVLLVPNRAVKTVGQQKVVTLLVNGKEEQVSVTLGLSNDTESEVLSGLKEGDVVVLPQTTTTTRGGPGGGLGGGFGGGFGR
jgi:HlyD family secretion protein